MKNTNPKGTGNTTITVIFLTTKKGQEKGTKDIYMINQDGKVSDGIMGVTGIHFNSNIPIGLGAKNAVTSILYMNPESIIIDPLHPVESIEAEDLSEYDKAALDALIDGIKVQKVQTVQEAVEEEVEGTKDTITSSMEEILEAFNSIKSSKIDAKRFMELISEGSFVEIIKKLTPAAHKPNR